MTLLISDNQSYRYKNRDVQEFLAHPLTLKICDANVRGGGILMSQTLYSCDTQMDTDTARKSKHRFSLFLLY